MLGLGYCGLQGACRCLGAAEKELRGQRTFASCAGRGYVASELEPSSKDTKCVRSIGRWIVGSASDKFKQRISAVFMNARESDVGDSSSRYCETQPHVNTCSYTLE